MSGRKLTEEQRIFRNNMKPLHTAVNRIREKYPHARAIPLPLLEEFMRVGYGEIKTETVVRKVARWAKEEESSFAASRTPKL